jgi:Flp pilus assembly protein TadD
VGFLGVASLALLDHGDLARARHWSEESLRLAPDSPNAMESVEALVVQGSLSLAEADAEGATRYLALAQTMLPDDGRIWSGLGLASLLAQDVDQAQARLERATRSMPGHIGTWHALAWCRLLSGRPNEASRDFEHALALDRNFSESHGGMAVALAALGRRLEAEVAMETALRLDRTCLSAQYARALLGGETGDPVQFRRFAKRALAGRRSADGRLLSDLVLGKDADE